MLVFSLLQIGLCCMQCILFVYSNVYEKSLQCACGLRVDMHRFIFQTVLLIDQLSLNAVNVFYACL